jgi:hypothetical protein
MPAFGVQLEQHFWRYERSNLDYTWVHQVLSLVVSICRSSKLYDIAKERL